MKRCNNCGKTLDDNVLFCPECGSKDLITAEQPAEETIMTVPVTSQQNAAAAEAAALGNGNVIAGIVGAFLFSLIGGLLYFVLYQMDIIAGICGLVIFILAYFGYGLFAGIKNKPTIVGMITAIVCMIVVIFAAEYISVAYVLYDVLKLEGMELTFFDAVRLMPEFLSDSEVVGAVVGDLAFAYIFGIIGIISNVIRIIKEKKAVSR